MSAPPPGTGSGRLPAWVVPPEPVLSGVELLLLEWGAETGAPGPVASWYTLQWVHGADGAPAPVTNAWCAATFDRATAEFELATAMLSGHAYPDASWFRGRGLAAGEVPCAEWWDAHTGWLWGREVARGMATTLGWALGVLPDPVDMVPFLYEDGTRIPDPVRRRWAGRLLDRMRVADPATDDRRAG